jgi:hypothetical protein
MPRSCLANPRAEPPFCTDVSLVVIKTQLSISGRCARQQQMDRNR